MTFMPEKVTIYSVGLLGGSLGLALKNSGFKGKITGLSSPSAIETAKRLGCIDEGFTYDSLQDVIKDTDLLFLCSPISVILETLNKLSTMELPEGLLITDVGSTKQKIMEAAAFLPPHVYFCGGHPMTGSEKSGPSVSDPISFKTQFMFYLLHLVQADIWKNLSPLSLKSILDAGLFSSNRPFTTE